MMRASYEIHAGGRAVSVRDAPSAMQALRDHLRSLGCSDREIIRLGTATVAWRGAVYRAAPPAPAPEPAAGLP